MMKSLLVFAVVIFGLMMMGFQVWPTSGQDISGSAENGKSLYLKYCSTCHGVDGRGEGTAAVYLFPKPRDFSRGVFKFQSTPSGSLPTDDDLERTLRNGMPGSAMPAWDVLSVEERTDLVAYVKSFSERFKTDTTPEPLVVGQEPLSTLDRIRKGKAVFALAGCWMCHGTTGTGDGPSSKNLADEDGRPIPPYNFTRAGAFKGGGRPQDIYRTFSAGIGGTPMPGYGEDALAVGRESFGDLTNLEGYYSSDDVGEFKKFISQWPSEEELNHMTLAERKNLADDRRWSLVYYVLSLSKGKSQISYTTTDHKIESVLTDDIAKFADPAFQGWNAVKSEELALISLWQRDTPIDRVTVKSVTDGKSLAFRLEWEDATQDDQALHVGKFGDAAAIQLPLDPASQPFFGMGDTNFAVNIWQWKSWWEADLKKYAGVDNAFPRNDADFYFFDVSGGSRMEYFVSKDSASKISMPWNAGWASANPLSSQLRVSPVEDLNARGFGTLTSQGSSEQNVSGKGIWKDDKWSVVFVRPLASNDRNDVVLKSGMSIAVSFAVWDGSLQDRNGQKMVTNWYKFSIEAK
ncbi:MAG: c-type cytochrome [Ignavibacteriales bacterium]|nr:c-type cytochrome [Ignavibacteriales bacterium]